MELSSGMISIHGNMGDKPGRNTMATAKKAATTAVKKTATAAAKAGNRKTTTTKQRNR